MIADNAGYDSADLVAKLRAAHTEGKKTYGLGKYYLLLLKRSIIIVFFPFSIAISIYFKCLIFVQVPLSTYGGPVIELPSVIFTLSPL